MLTKEFIVGGTGVGSSTVLYPALMNMLLGTKMRVVTGYADGVSVHLAMERGEVMGVCGPFLTTIKANHPHWITEKKFVVPIAVDRQRLPEYPGHAGDRRVHQRRAHACRSSSRPSPPARCSARFWRRPAYRRNA